MSSLTIREMALPDNMHLSQTPALSTHPQAHLASLRALLRTPFLMAGFVGDPPTLPLPMPQYLLSFPSPLSWWRLMVTPTDRESADKNRKTLQALQGFNLKWCRRAESNRRHEDFQI